jgi:hypothetical protein
MRCARKWRDVEMGLVELTAEAVDDGRAMDALNVALERIAQDVIERPGVGGARKVTLVISVTPTLDDDMNNMPEIHASVAWKLPGWAGAATFGKVEDGKVLVNPWDGNPNQGVLSFADRKERES